jgi:hypothetical protein
MCTSHAGDVVMAPMPLIFHLKDKLKLYTNQKPEFSNPSVGSPHNTIMGIGVTVDQQLASKTCDALIKSVHNKLVAANKRRIDVAEPIFMVVQLTSPPSQDELVPKGQFVDGIA